MANSERPPSDPEEHHGAGDDGAAERVDASAPSLGDEAAERAETSANEAALAQIAAEIDARSLDAAVRARDVAPQVAPLPAVKTVPGSATDPLRVLPWIAAVGVAALVMGRFVAPALPGAVVGMARAVRFVEVFGAALSQLFAVGAIAGLVIALLGSANSTVPAFLRLAGLCVSGWVSLMVVFGAITADRLAETPALIGALCAGAFAILCAVASRASPVTRLPAVILGLIGTAASLRALHGLVDVEAAGAIPEASLQSAGRYVATIAAVLVGLALLLALVHIGRTAPAEAEPGQPAKSSLWSPATIVVLVLAVVCARQAVAGGAADAGLASVLLKRASDRFLVHPEPHLRLAVRLFLGFLAPLVAAALLFVRRVRSLTAAVALAVVAADISGAPLGAIALVLASLGVLLVARNGHVLWSALIARPPATPRASS